MGGEAERPRPHRAAVASEPGRTAPTPTPPRSLRTLRRDQPNHHAGSALLAASYKGHAPVVRLLLQHGAQVNSHRGDGLTALCQASKAGHLRVAQLLLDKRADVNAAGAT